MIIKSISLQKTINVNLVDLKSVNYLVGRNASGKSQILEALPNNEGFELYQDLVDRSTSPPASQLAIVSLDFPRQRLETQIDETLLRDGLVPIDKYDILDTIRITLQSPTKEMLQKRSKPRLQGNQEIRDILRSRAIDFVDVAGHQRLQIPLSQVLLSSGENALFWLHARLEQYMQNDKHGNKPSMHFVFTLDEPENGFHPAIQKTLPKFFEEVCNKYRSKGMLCQFFIATHSPFIASAAAEYVDTQKIYLLDQGSAIDLNRKPRNVSRGYRGKQCLNIVSQMLGAGFEDLCVSPATHEKFTVIYCEGAGKSTKDSVLYHKIFPSRNIIFVSCGDLKEAEVAFRVALKGVKFMFGADTTVRALLDRSYGKEYDKSTQFPFGTEIIQKTHGEKPIFTEDEREAMMNTDPENRIVILKRKEIENYLCDPEVVKHLDPRLLKNMNIPDGIDYEQGEVKDLIEFGSSKSEILGSLAQIISEHKTPQIAALYNELASYIGVQTEY